MRVIGFITEPSAASSASWITSEDETESLALPHTPSPPWPTSPESPLRSRIHHGARGELSAGGLSRRPRAPTSSRLTQAMGSPPPHWPAIGTRGGALRPHQGGVQEFKLL